MNFDLFFAGMENKETWASAWLATLLRDDATFRRAFFETIKVDPRIDPDENYNVRVETPLGIIGACDVTLAGDTTCVFIENKVSKSAVTAGQFGGYYRGVTDDATLGGQKRAIGIYLAPDRRIGEAQMSELAATLTARQAAGYLDKMVSLSWKEDFPAHRHCRRRQPVCA